MRVRSLISMLKEMDQEAEVFFTPPYDVYDYTVDTVVSRIDITSKEEEVVRVYIGTDPMGLDFEID